MVAVLCILPLVLLSVTTTQGAHHALLVLLSVSDTNGFLFHVNGQWGAWTSYGACSVSCGTGSSTAWRYCNNPAPSHGGHQCHGPHTQTEVCHGNGCPMDGAWGTWTGYQACSVTCGTGSKTRYRYCNSPRPLNGGHMCPGADHATISCQEPACYSSTGHVNGGWSTWSEYTTCSHTCGGGTQSTFRWCDQPRPSGGGANCTGSDISTIACNSQSCSCSGSTCPVDGQWGIWSNYQACSTTCGTGSQTRFRYCNNPHQAHGGKQCVGLGFEKHSCYNTACSGGHSIINGGWSLWSNYGSCSKTCGTGQQSRYRKCDHPTPSAGGSICTGVSQDTRTCNSFACACSGTKCPVDGHWGSWLPYSSCSHTCGTGTKTKWRYCNNPSPSHGGHACTGSQTDVQSCNLASCAGPSPVDGAWATWSSYGQCSQTCGTSATHTRTRTCSHPTPAHGGSLCSGLASQTQSCALAACPASSCGTTLVSTTSTKIVGGTQAQHGQFPWQVSLQYFGSHICGGTLISDQWVMTAAHCFEDLPTYPSQWTIGVGLHDLQHTYGSNTAHVAQIFVNEHHSAKSEENDITLIKLTKPLDITGKFIRPACLPQPQDSFSSDTCAVSGWGATYYDADGNAPGTRYLNYVNLDTITNSACRNLMGWNNIYNSNICAGAIHGGGKDSCQGDSGGPMVCQKHGVWNIVGVVSWGDGCGKSMSPGVYTRVTSYLSWIHQKMNNN